MIALSRLILPLSLARAAWFELRILPLPLGVTATVDQTLERTFTHAVRESADGINLIWESAQRDVTGVAPRPGCHGGHAA